MQSLTEDRGQNHLSDNDKNLNTWGGRGGALTPVRGYSSGAGRGGAQNGQEGARETKQQETPECDIKKLREKNKNTKEDKKNIRKKCKREKKKQNMKYKRNRMNGIKES